MPTPKRWHPVSRDLNDDAELWEFTERFGDRALRTYLEVLANVDKSDNSWRMTSHALASISRKTRQMLATVQREVDWMVEKGWLVISEQAAEGSPAILSTRNYWKYHKRRELKGAILEEATESFGARDRAPSYPNLSFPNLKKKREEGVGRGGAQLRCEKRVEQAGDSFLRPCGKPASPKSRPAEPRCSEHMAMNVSVEEKNLAAI